MINPMYLIFYWSKFWGYKRGDIYFDQFKFYQINSAIKSQQLLMSPNLGRSGLVHLLGFALIGFYRGPRPKLDLPEPKFVTLYLHTQEWRSSAGIKLWVEG